MTAPIGYGDWFDLVSTEAHHRHVDHLKLWPEIFSALFRGKLRGPSVPPPQGTTWAGLFYQGEIATRNKNDPSRWRWIQHIPLPADMKELATILDRATGSSNSDRKQPKPTRKGTANQLTAALLAMRTHYPNGAPVGPTKQIHAAVNHWLKQHDFREVSVSVVNRARREMRDQSKK